MENRNNDLAWRVGGPQGSGVDTAAQLFSFAVAYGGLHLFGRREYYSNIIGRHSYFDVRLADHQLTSHREEIDLLAAFEPETLARHSLSLVSEGTLVYNRADSDVPLERITFLDSRLRQDLAAYLDDRGDPPATSGLLQNARQRGVKTVGIPFDALIDDLAAREEVSKSIAQRALNTIAVAASLALFGFDPRYLLKSLERVFSGRDRVIEMNATAVELTYAMISEDYSDEIMSLELEPADPPKGRLLLNGNQAVALGKLAGGMTFQTYYPISPATDESVFLEEHADMPLRDGDSNAGLVVVQTEDELAAVTMASGAALTGARSATATAGPGFSLMVEGLGWAGMNELPLVITLYQRGSPGTGMPTRTEQGDLLFAIHAGHGEFPRLVLASGDVEDAFHDASSAFNYAERFQMPVIHLLDKAIASATQTLEGSSMEASLIERGELYAPNGEDGKYERFAVTESGISPRAFLGQPGGTHWLTGAEHTPVGMVTEDPSVRERMVEKRARKLATAAQEIPAEEKVAEYGKSGAGMTVLSWGSNKGAVLEALDLLQADRIDARFVHVRLLWPFPVEELQRLVEKASPLIVVEANYSGQFAGLVQAQTGIIPDHLVVKYNGRPISGIKLYEALGMVHEGKAGPRIVLRNPYE